MLKDKIILIILLSIGIPLSGYLIYSHVKTKSLEYKVGKQEVQLEVAKDAAKTEVLETKWETIAVEHNKSIGDVKNEIKEPVSHHDDNITDFFFFGMF